MLQHANSSRAFAKKCKPQWDIQRYKRKKECIGLLAESIGKRFWMERQAVI